MTIRISTVAECETVQFLPTRKTKAEWTRLRDTDSNDMTYVVKFNREGRESEFMTPDYVRAKMQYEFWRDIVWST